MNTIPDTAPEFTLRHTFDDLPDGETLATSGAVKVGMLATEYLVTDTRTWLVTKVAGNTVTLAAVAGDPIAKTSNDYGSPFPVVTEYYDANAATSDYTIRRRIRKDGTIRTAGWSRPLGFGEYGYRLTDYRY